MIKAVFVHSLSLALGVIVGATVFGERLSADQSAAASASNASLLAHFQPAGSDSSFDAMQMRAVLREELGAALKSALTQSGVSSRTAPAAAPVVTSVQQQQEAMQNANQIIASGQWGETERVNFHQQLAQLDPVQAEQAMQTLVRAIDNGSLRVTTQGPPL